MREFCGLKRNSESLEVAALLYGMLPKLVPRLPLAFLSFQSAVRSMKPTGMMVVSPTLICKGDEASAAATGCGEGGVKMRGGATAAGTGGNMGGVEAISPRPAARGGAAAAAVLAAVWASLLIWVCKAVWTCSICFCCAASWALRAASSAAVAAGVLVLSAGSAAKPVPRNATAMRDNANAAVRDFVIVPSRKLEMNCSPPAQRYTSAPTDLN